MAIEISNLAAITMKSFRDALFPPGSIEFSQCDKLDAMGATITLGVSSITLSLMQHGIVVKVNVTGLAIMKAVKGQLGTVGHKFLMEGVTTAVGNFYDQCCQFYGTALTELTVPPQAEDKPKTSMSVLLDLAPFNEPTPEDWEDDLDELPDEPSIAKVVVDWPKAGGEIGMLKPEAPEKKGLTREEVMKLDRVPLIAATLLYHPVKGSDGSSTYHVVALGDGIAAALRIRNNLKISLRLEGAKLSEYSKEAVLVGFGAPSGEHVSIHLDAKDDVLAKKTVGSLLFATGIPFTKLATDVLYLRGKGT